MIIYKITNKHNEKIYIGQTTKDLSTRFRQHCQRKRMREAWRRRKEGAPA